MKRFVNGVNIAYGLAGDCLPVVFIHGFPLSREMWSRQVEHVESLCSTVALDLRGHGESDKPDTPFTIDVMADDVLSLLSDLRVGQAVFVGHSMGGYVALRAYSRRPGAFKGMVLVNTRAEADSPEARKGRLETASRVRAGGGGAFRKDFAEKLLSDKSRAHKPELYSELGKMMEESPDSMMARSLEAMAGRPDSLSLLPRISVPTLIVAGAEDKVMPMISAQALKSGIPGSRLAVIDEAGHMVNMEEPEAFNSELREFLDSIAQ
jgi:pimeloyl-ACP methyl ester carboxylesterase